MSICRNPTVVCRVTQNVEEDMQAKATERSRFLTWEERNFPRRTPTPFFVCVRLSSLFHHPPPPQPTPLSPAGSQQSTCVVHSTRCCRLRVVAFLGLTLPPSPANSGSVPLHFFVHLTPQILKSQTCAFGVINQA